MKRKVPIPQILILLAITMSLFIYAESEKESTLIPAGWFDNKGKVVDPVKSTLTFNNNLAFHRVSWQYFLWLTEEVNGEIRFETLFNDSAIDPHYKPAKKHTLKGVRQAGSNSILVDGNGRAVYTTMMINNTYRQFCIDHKLYTVEGMQGVDPSLDFPNHALSLKASWRIVGEGEDTSRFYTQKATLEKLINKDGQITFSKTEKLKDITVALIGLHIAVTVKGHPEFVWATFEHVDNSPVMQPGQKMNEPVSDKNYTFYKAGTIAGDCNAKNESVLRLDENSQTLTPISQVALQYKNGGGSDTNQRNIESLNKAVHKLLGDKSVWKNYKEVGAVWFNQVDGLNPGWTPNVDPSLLTGSTKLSNSTIETFTQAVKSENECFSCHNTMAVTFKADGLPSLAAKNVNTSHILLQNFLNKTEMKKITPPKQKPVLKRN